MNIQTLGASRSSIRVMRIGLLTVGIVLLVEAGGGAQGLSCEGHLVTIAPDGGVREGSKQALRDAMRKGTSIRVGWAIDGNGDGVADVSHWADASFLTAWQGEVFAQVPDIQRQAPRIDPTRIEMPAGEQRWTGLLGTTGTLSGHFSDGTAAPAARVTSTWCVASCPPPSWRLVYQHDADGKPLAGAKDALFDAVRRGYPIRLAWGASFTEGGLARSVEHSAEPVFVTIMNGSELFVQLPEHIAQASYVDPEKAVFEDPAVMWRGLMGTNGSFDAVYVDRSTGKEVRRLPQRVRLAWFAMAPESACAPQPIVLAVPGGVRRVP